MRMKHILLMSAMSLGLALGHNAMAASTTPAKPTKATGVGKSANQLEASLQSLAQTLVAIGAVAQGPMIVGSANASQNAAGYIDNINAELQDMGTTYASTYNSRSYLGDLGQLDMQASAALNVMNQQIARNHAAINSLVTDTSTLATNAATLASNTADLSSVVNTDNTALTNFGLVNSDGGLASGISPVTTLEGQLATNTDYINAVAAPTFTSLTAAEQANANQIGTSQLALYDMGALNSQGNVAAAIQSGPQDPNGLTLQHLQTMTQNNSTHIDQNSGAIGTNQSALLDIGALNNVGQISASVQPGAQGRLTLQGINTSAQAAKGQALVNSNSIVAAQQAAQQGQQIYNTQRGQLQSAEKANATNLTNMGYQVKGDTQMINLDQQSLIAAGAMTAGGAIPQALQSGQLNLQTLQAATQNNAAAEQTNATNLTDMGYQVKGNMSAINSDQQALIDAGAMTTGGAIPQALQNGQLNLQTLQSAAQHNAIQIATDANNARNFARGDMQEMTANQANDAAARSQMQQSLNSKIMQNYQNNVNTMSDLQHTQQVLNQDQNMDASQRQVISNHLGQLYNLTQSQNNQLTNMIHQTARNDKLMTAATLIDMHHNVNHIEAQGHAVVNAQDKVNQILADNGSGQVMGDPKDMMNTNTLGTDQADEQDLEGEAADQDIPLISDQAAAQPAGARAALMFKGYTKAFNKLHRQHK